MKKEIPIPEFDTSHLFILPQQALKWELLKTAIELNLFDYLTFPAPAAKISQSIGLQPANTEYILNALVAMGCLVKNKETYQNTPQTETFLTTEKETSLGASLLFMEQWISPLLNGGLMKILREGPPPSRNLAEPAMWEKGARASVNHTRCGRAQQITGIVAALPEFSAFSKILDIGAGPGIIGIAVTAAHPGISCLLFDQPAVCRVAEETVAEYGMEDRVAVQCGDYMKDDFGTGYDLIMANFTLNFYRDSLNEIVSKVHNALNPGGIFLVTSDGLSPDGTSPEASVISWLPTMLYGNDISFVTGKIAEAMLNAGFVSTEQRTLTEIELEAHGPVELTIGRKRR